MGGKKKPQHSSVIDLHTHTVCVRAHYWEQNAEVDKQMLGRVGPCGQACEWVSTEGVPGSEGGGEGVTHTLRAAK